MNLPFLSIPSTLRCLDTTYITIVSGQTVISIYDTLKLLPNGFYRVSVMLIYQCMLLFMDDMPYATQLCAIDTKLRVNTTTSYSPRRSALCRHVSSTSTRAGFSSAAATRSLSFSCLLTLGMRVAFSHCRERMDVTKPH
jgi:hypothetical protein